jgi:hypothetical protein
MSSWGKRRSKEANCEHLPNTQILLATDGSDEAKMATQAATELSRETGSEVHVVYLLPSPAQLIGHHLYPDEMRESLIGGPRGTPRRSSRSRRSRSGRTAGRWRRLTSGVEIRTRRSFARLRASAWA